MKETADLAGKRDAQAKKKYKEVHDRKVTERDMQVGDLVLALEPNRMTRCKLHILDHTK